jgi:pimeloyl-ACP methyl ester carboxylesterase
MYLLDVPLARAPLETEWIPLNLSRALRFFSPSNRFVRRLIMLPAKPVPLALCRVVTWSLGGIYARKLAKHFPELVRQVITLATPFADSIACTLR